jgi:hypothetical protein
VRAVLDDQNVTFATIQAHLQSNDPDIQYFYQTLAARYDDAQLLAPLPSSLLSKHITLQITSTQQHFMT